MLLYAAVAVWVDFGHVHRLHNSDSLVGTLASQYALTPFFWEQDRTGWLVPALISWCPDPLAALLLYTGLAVFLGLAAPLLLAEVVSRRPVGRAAATLANATMLAFAPEGVRDNLLYVGCYPQAIALGCAGLLVLSRGGDRPRLWRFWVAAGLFVLAHWVYVAVAVWLMPLAFWTTVIRPGVPFVGLRDAACRLVRYFPGWTSLMLLGGAFGVGLWFSQLAHDANPGLIRPTPRDSLPRDEWPASWRGYIESLDQFTETRTWVAAACALAAAGLLTSTGIAVTRRRWPAYPLVAAVSVLGLSGLTEFLFIGTREWPAENDRHPRYIIGFLVSAQLILGLAAVFPFANCAAGRGRWVIFGAAAAILLGGATVRYGFPSPWRPRTDLDANFGQLTPDIVAADLDAIGGDYWTVWPAVFHANMAGPPRNRPLIGITGRCGVFRPQWERIYPAGMRVGVKDTQNELTSFSSEAKRCGLTAPVRIGTQGGLAVYSTRPAATLDGHTH
jgi:hypothetical protein